MWAKVFFACTPSLFVYASVGVVMRKVFPLNVNGLKNTDNSSAELFESEDRNRFDFMFFELLKFAIFCDKKYSGLFFKRLSLSNFGDELGSTNTVCSILTKGKRGNARSGYLLNAASQNNLQIAFSRLLTLAGEGGHIKSKLPGNAFVGNELHRQDIGQVPNAPQQQVWRGCSILRSFRGAGVLSCNSLTGLPGSQVSSYSHLNAVLCQQRHLDKNWGVEEHRAALQRCRDVSHACHSVAKWGAGKV